MVFKKIGKGFHRTEDGRFDWITVGFPVAVYTVVIDWDYGVSVKAETSFDALAWAEKRAKDFPNVLTTAGGVA